MEILFEDEEIQVVRRAGASSFTLVTFASLASRPEPGFFWGHEPATHLDLDCIGFISKRDNWYPTASVERSADIVRRTAKPVSIGYGYSMGGYAALKHGRRLGLARVLAVAPQISIDPADVPDDLRYHRFFQADIHRGMRVRAEELAPWTAVLADPRDPEDRQHTDYLARIGSVQLLPAAFMGHAAIWLLTGTSVLSRALQCVLDADTAGLWNLLRKQRLNSAVWCYRAGAAALRHGHEVLAERLCERARKLRAPPALMQEAQAQALFTRSTRLSAAGRRSEATAAVKRAIAIQPHDARMLMHAGHLVLSEGNSEEAERLFRDALALDGELGHAHFGLSVALARQGRHRQGISHAERAVSLLPRNAEVPAWLGHLLISQGDAQGAEDRFTQALAIDDGIGHAYLGLSRALAMQNRQADALSAAERGAERLPANAELRKRVEMLRTVPVQAKLESADS